MNSRGSAFQQWASINGGCRWSNSPPAAPSLSGSWRHSPRLACLSSSSSPAPRPGGSESKFYKPIDEADRIDDWLYLPETLYAFMLIMVISAGAGPYSLDALILGLMNKHVA